MVVRPAARPVPQDAAPRARAMDGESRGLVSGTISPNAGRPKGSDVPPAPEQPRHPPPPRGPDHHGPDERRRRHSAQDELKRESLRLVCQPTSEGLIGEADGMGKTETRKVVKRERRPLAGGEQEGEVERARQRGEPIRQGPAASRREDKKRRRNGKCEDAGRNAQAQAPHLVAARPPASLR